MAPLVKGKRRITKAPKAKQPKLAVADEPEVADEPVVDEAEPEIVEDEAVDDGTNTALVIEKATGKTFEATRVVTREPELVDADGAVTTDPEGEPSGEIVSTLTFEVNGEVLSESEFYRRFTPVNHVEAKKLRQEE